MSNIDPKAKIYAILADSVYWDVRESNYEKTKDYSQSNWTPVPSDWKLIHEVSKSGGSWSQSNAFTARAYQNGNEVVIAFAGTNPADFVGDMGANTALFTGLLQGKDGYALQASMFYHEVKEMIKKNPNATIKFTGHSLGGGLAGIMGILFNKEAFIFDPAPFMNAVEPDLLDIIGKKESTIISTIKAELQKQLDKNKISNTGFQEIDNNLLTYSYDDNYEARARNLNAMRVKGEFLEYFEYLGNHFDNVDIKELFADGKTTLGILGALDKHSQTLLVSALLDEKGFGEYATNINNNGANEETLSLIFDKKLYGYTQGSEKQNFLSKLVRSHIGTEMGGGIDYATGDIVKKDDEIPKGSPVKYTGKSLLSAFGHTLKILAENLQPYDMNNRYHKLGYDTLIANAIEWYYHQDLNVPMRKNFINLNNNTLQFTTAQADKLTDKYNDQIKDYAQKWVTQAYLDIVNLWKASEDVTKYDQWTVALNGSSANALNPDKTQILITFGNGATFTAGDKEDLLFGYDGDDTLTGGKGEDIIYGGKGEDKLYGGDGDDKDILIGGADADTLYGGDGDDILIGGTNEKSVQDNNAQNKLYGEAGDDTLKGSGRLEGGKDYDTYYAYDTATVRDEDGQGILYYHDKHLFGAEMMVESDSLTPPTKLDFTKSGYDIKDTTTNRLKVVQRTDKYVRYRVTGDISFVYDKELTTDALSDKELGIQFFVTVHKKGYEPPPSFPTKMPPPAPPLPPPPPRDPLVLDLNGDGKISTLPKEKGVYFDLDNSGFAEKTAWVSDGDGIVVWDKNNNGHIDGGYELFGTETLLKNNTLAPNGYVALAEHDNNGDGIINQLDNIYKNLQIWQDKNSNGLAESNELYTLSDLNIASISIVHTVHSQTDNNLVEHRERSQFTYKNGRTGLSETLWFSSDTVNSVPVAIHQGTPITISEDIQLLPDVVGFGNVYSLRHAMQLDSTGTLKALVERFISSEFDETEDKEAALLSLTHDIILHWTGQQNVDRGIYGDRFNAQHIEVMKKIWGQLPIDTSSETQLATVIPIYEQFANYVYTMLMAQSHLAGIYDQMHFYHDKTGEWTTDFEPVNQYVMTQVKNGIDHRQITQRVERFVHGLNPYTNRLLDAFKNSLESYKEQKGIIISTGTLTGDDRSNELYGSEHNDHFDGGLGDDFMMGYEGNDTYVVDSHNDVIVDNQGDNALIVKSQDGYTLSENHNIRNITIDQDAKGKVTTNNQDSIIVSHNENTQIDAKEGNNNIRVNLGGEILASNGSNTIHLGTGNYKVVLGDGNNLIANDYRKQQNLDITLGDGNNNIKAQSANSTIIAGDGNNVIHLEGGNYHLMLGNGSNTVRIQEKFPFDHIAPEEPNQIQVGDGNNTIISELDGSVIATLGNGHNTLELQDGNHIINTGIGNNTISTKNGNQTITATGGNNTITFGNGTHHIQLADGNDLVTLGTGTHDVTLGDGNNQATTYGNDSHIKGGVHQDVLITGGSGNTLTGGEGADTFKVLLDSNNTIITDLQANDSLELSLRHTYLHEHLGSIYLGKRDVDTKSYYPFPKFKVARSTIGTNHELIEYSVGDKTGRFAQITYRPEGNGLSIEITQDNQRITIANFKNLTDIETIQALHNVSVKLNDGSRGGTYSHSPDIQRILKDYTSTSYILNESTISFKNLLDAGTIRAYYESGDDIINGLTDYNGNHYLAVYLDWSKADFENAPYVNVGDIIFAGAGNDTITTGMGSSIVFGEDGDDTIIASDAHASDIIHAGDGDDTIWVNSPQTRPEDSPSDSAEHNTDYIFAGAGNDIIHSQNKNQETKLEGGDGNDQIHMVAGIALGGSGSDIITANGNNAVKIYGESGNDTLTGGNHHDHLDGGEGDDRLIGGNGNDHLDGGEGTDTLIGGNGDDTYIADASDTYLEKGQDLEGGYDTIHINSDFDLSTNNFEAVTLLGDGNFNVIGDQFDNNIIGNTGNNRLFGGAGADYISAGEGDDHLDGGTDADTLVGGDGNDYYILDNEHDIITENFNQGIDTVEQWTDRYFYHTDESGNLIKTTSYRMLQDNIENLILKGDTKTAFGNELDNIITLNTQNNFVNAMAGNDTIIYQKGGGKDTIANTDNIQNKDTLIIEGYDPSEAVFVRVKNTAGNDMLQIRFKNNPNDTITLLNYFTPTNTNELGTQQDNKIDEIIFRGQGADQVLTNTQFELLIIDQAKNTAPKANKHPKAINAEVGKVLSVQFDADTIKDTDAYDSQLKYKLTLATKDSNGQYEAIPDWLTFDPVTRTLTGTPPKGTNNQTITHQFILWGEDSFNYSAGVYVTLNIASQTTTPPAVTTPPTNPKPTTQEVPYLKDINNSRGINNTYLYSGGKYTLQDRSGTDTLRFANHIKASQITRSFSKSGNDLILKIDNQDKDTLIIKDFFTTQGRIERMVFGNGAALTYQQFYNAFGINTRTASTSGVSSIGIRSLSESWSTKQTHDHYIQNVTNTLIQSMSLLPESSLANTLPTAYQDHTQTIGQLWQVAISPV